MDGQMMNWHTLLARVLDKLVESAKGNDCIEFWDTILSNFGEGGSGGIRYITGWASVFGVFDRKGKWIANMPDSNLWPEIDMALMPVGVCAVPVTVDDNGTEYKTQMSAGHFSFTTEKEGKAICPSIDWVIELEDDFNKRNHIKK